LGEPLLGGRFVAHTANTNPMGVFANGLKFPVVVATALPNSPDGVDFSIGGRARVWRVKDLPVCDERGCVIGGHGETLDHRKV